MNVDRGLVPAAFVFLRLNTIILLQLSVVFNQGQRFNYRPFMKQLATLDILSLRRQYIQFAEY